jgi:hypothetical protein
MKMIVSKEIIKSIKSLESDIASLRRELVYHYLNEGAYSSRWVAEVPIKTVIDKILEHLDLSISEVPATSATIKLTEKTHESKFPKK